MPGATERKARATCWLVLTSFKHGHGMMFLKKRKRELGEGERGNQWEEKGEDDMADLEVVAGDGRSGEATERKLAEELGCSRTTSQAARSYWGRAGMGLWRLEAKGRRRPGRRGRGAARARDARGVAGLEGIGPGGNDAGEERGEKRDRAGGGRRTRRRRGDLDEGLC